MADQQYPQYQYPEPSRATTVLVLGILGLVLCGVLAPFAWVMGNTELAAIDAGRRDPTRRSTANAGRILGIIGTFLLVLIPVLAILAVTFVGPEVDRINEGGAWGTGWMYLSRAT